jgi:hypothetical protein
LTFKGKQCQPSGFVPASSTFPWVAAESPSQNGLSLLPVLGATAIDAMPSLSVREHAKPAIGAPPERMFATDDRGEAGTRVGLTFGTCLTAATIDATAAVEHPNAGHDDHGPNHARPTGPHGHAHGSPRKQTPRRLRQPQPQRQRAQRQRQQQSTDAPPKCWSHKAAANGTRNQARREKRATLAQAGPPTEAQNLVPVGFAQGMVGETVEGVRPSSQPIDSSSQRPRNARNRHDTLGASLTAVP